MPRPKKDPAVVASKLVATRLTPSEYEMLLRMVEEANRGLASSGLTPLVTPASFILSCFLRVAAMEKQPEAPLMVHGPRRRPHGERGELPPPTRYRRIAKGL